MYILRFLKEVWMDLFRFYTFDCCRTNEFGISEFRKQSYFLYFSELQKKDQIVWMCVANISYRCLLEPMFYIFSRCWKLNRILLLPCCVKGVVKGLCRKSFFVALLKKPRGYPFHPKQDRKWTFLMKFIVFLKTGSEFPRPFNKVLFLIKYKTTAWKECVIVKSKNEMKFDHIFLILLGSYIYCRTLF